MAGVSSNAMPGVLFLLSKPPTSTRELLDFLRFYRNEVGLQPLLDFAQGDEWTPRQIFYAVHGRLISATANRQEP